MIVSPPMTLTEPNSSMRGRSTSPLMRNGISRTRGNQLVCAKRGRGPLKVDAAESMGGEAPCACGEEQDAHEIDGVAATDALNIEEPHARRMSV